MKMRNLCWTKTHFLRWSSQCCFGIWIKCPFLVWHKWWSIMPIISKKIMKIWSISSPKRNPESSKTLPSSTMTNWSPSAIHTSKLTSLPIGWSISLSEESSSFTFRSAGKIKKEYSTWLPVCLISSGKLSSASVYLKS